MTRFWTTALFA